MCREGFETMIPVFERAKKVHALDHAATLIGWDIVYRSEYKATPYFSKE
jgi:hypothetical protein